MLLESEAASEYNPSVFMLTLIRSRVHPGASALLVVLIILILQNELSDSLTIGGLSPQEIDSFVSDDIQNLLWQVIKVAVFVPAVLFWLMNRRRWLQGALVFSNALLTFQLLASTVLMVATLGIDAPPPGSKIITDTILVGVNNVLCFALWYWLVDGPRMRQESDRAGSSWDFLFPQRASPIPGYNKWEPHFSDYLFLAITTATSFGPADTLPLSRRAKLLMGLQIIIAFVTISVLAARALSILTD
jgi:hypothetical protein